MTDYVSIYREAYREYGVKCINEKFSQTEAEEYALQAVVNKAKEEQFKEMADRYLNFSAH